jgi:hypothetical protein
MQELRITSRVAHCTRCVQGHLTIVHNVRSVMPDAKPYIPACAHFMAVQGSTQLNVDRFWTHNSGPLRMGSYDNVGAAKCLVGQLMHTTLQHKRAQLRFSTAWRGGGSRAVSVDHADCAPGYSYGAPMVC